MSGAEASEGAGIFCCRCGARPFPEVGPPGTREDFDLKRLNAEGCPAEGDAGRWYCSRHFVRVGANQYQLKDSADGR
jgi:hypothetical protein